MKIASLVLALTGTLGILAAPALSQTAPSASTPKNVSRTTKAVNYRRAGAAKIDFQGTELMQQASGDARVQNKGSRTEIDAKFLGLDEATKFGLEYLTYVLWAVSPGGRAVNLGEVVLKNGAGEVKAISDMQTFGMIVTAEPYFAVTQPGNTVVLENVFGPTTLGKVENIDASYELLGRGIYSSSNTKIENAIFGIDRKTPLELFEARNSIRIAHIALADKYAAPTLAKAELQLRNAEEVYGRKSDKKSVIAAAREVVETPTQKSPGTRKPPKSVKPRPAPMPSLKCSAARKPRKLASKPKPPRPKLSACSRKPSKLPPPPGVSKPKRKRPAPPLYSSNKPRKPPPTKPQKTEPPRKPPPTKPEKTEPPRKPSSALPKPKPKKRARPPRKPKRKRPSFAPSFSPS